MIVENSHLSAKYIDPGVKFSTKWSIRYLSKGILYLFGNHTIGLFKFFAARRRGGYEGYFTVGGPYQGQAKANRASPLCYTK